MDDSEDEDIELGYHVAEMLCVLATVEASLPSSSRSIPRQPRMLSSRGYKIVVECLQSDRECMETTRMDNNYLRKLVDIFRNRYHVNTEGFSICLEEQVVMMLNYFAYGGSMSRVSIMFGHVKDTMSRILSNMLVPLHRLYVDEVRPVDQTRVHHKFTTPSPIRRAFQGCIGALDGTHVPMHPPSVESINWRGRPRIPTTNVLAICDHDLLFTYFAAGADGSYHDTHVLNKCRTTERLRFSEPLPGKFYLCDSGYVNKSGFMAPYRYRCYHPHEFEHNAPEDSEEFFNLIHSGLRSVIERTFGVWKNKWHIVHKGYSLVGFEVWKQLSIIDSTTSLHNFVRRRMNDVYLEPVEQREEEDDNVSIDLNRSPHPETLREEDWTVDRDNIARTIYEFR